MPFTISHAAAALACRRVIGQDRLMVSGLIVGTIVPDAEFLTHLRARRAYAHTPRGLFTFCVPVGLVALWLWRSYVAPELRFLLLGHSRHATSVPRLVPALLIVVARGAISILAGACTHLAWDALTHRDGSIVRMVPVLRRPVSSLIPLATFDALQHLSSLVGLFVVVIWFRRNAPRAMYPWTPSCDAAMAARRLVSWVVLAAAALGLGMFNGARRLRRPSGSLSRVVAAALVGAMAGVIGATLALAVASAALRTATRD